MYHYYEFQHYDFDVMCKRWAMDYATHMHDQLELLYVFEGTQLAVVGERAYTVEAGSCLAVYPNQLHRYIRPEGVTKEGSARSVMVFVPSRLLYMLFPELCGRSWSECMLTADRLSEDTRLAFTRLFQSDVVDMTARLGWSHIIMSDVIPQLSTVEVREGRSPEVISLVMGYISENYLESLTLDRLSDELGVSKYKISRIFSDKVQMSFRAYLGMLRANHAARLINSSNESLSKIAASSGFESTRSFYRAFRETYGISPAAYRDMVRKK